MDAPLQDYAHLTALAQQVSAGNGSAPMGFAAAAASEAIGLLDQQIGAISYAQIQGGFAGAAQMAAALAQMRNAASGWPATRAAIVAAASAAAAAGPAAAALGNGDTSPAQMAADVGQFAASTLAPIVAGFATATAAFNAFNGAMEQAYSNSENANQAAAAALTRERMQINNQLQNLQAQENDLKSAGSIIIGIFSFGTSYAVQIHEIEQQAQQLQNAEQQQAREQAWYQASLGSFMNAVAACKLANYALLTLSSSLQQAANSVDDMRAATSANMIVMSALLQQFKTEYAQTVVNVQKLLQ